MVSKLFLVIKISIRYNGASSKSMRFNRKSSSQKRSHNLSKHVHLPTMRIKSRMVSFKIDYSFCYAYRSLLEIKQSNHSKILVSNIQHNELLRPSTIFSLKVVNRSKTSKFVWPIFAVNVIPCLPGNYWNRTAIIDRRWYQALSKILFISVTNEDNASLNRS